MAQIKIRKYNPGGVLTTETGDTFTLEEIEQLVRENPTNENLKDIANELRAGKNVQHSISDNWSSVTDDDFRAGQKRRIAKNPNSFGRRLAATFNTQVHQYGEDVNDTTALLSAARKNSSTNTGEDTTGAVSVPVDEYTLISSGGGSRFVYDDNGAYVNGDFTNAKLMSLLRDLNDYFADDNGGASYKFKGISADVRKTLKEMYEANPNLFNDLMNKVQSGQIIEGSPEASLLLSIGIGSNMTKDQVEQAKKDKALKDYFAGKGFTEDQYKEFLPFVELDGQGLKLKAGVEGGPFIAGQNYYFNDDYNGVFKDLIKGQILFNNRFYDANQLAESGMISDWVKALKEHRFADANSMIKWDWKGVGDNYDYQLFDNQKFYNDFLDGKRYLDVTGQYEKTYDDDGNIYQIMGYYDPNDQNNYTALGFIDPSKIKYARFDSMGNLIDENYNIAMLRKAMNPWTHTSAFQERRADGQVVIPQVVTRNGRGVLGMDVTFDPDKGNVRFSGAAVQNVLGAENGDTIELDGEVAQILSPEFFANLEHSNSKDLSKFKDTILSLVGNKIGNVWVRDQLNRREWADLLRPTYGADADYYANVLFNYFKNYIGRTSFWSKHVPFASNPFRHFGIGGGGQSRQARLHEFTPKHQQGGLFTGSAVAASSAPKIVQSEKYMPATTEEAGAFEFGQFTNADWMELAGLGADLASVVTGATGLSPVSAITGLAGTGASFAADITRDGFQAKDLGNLGLGLIFDIASLIPYAGTAAAVGGVANKLRKGLPVLIKLAGIAGVGSSLSLAVNKIKSGEKLTMKDLRIIMNGVLGTYTLAKQGIDVTNSRKRDGVDIDVDLKKMQMDRIDASNLSEGQKAAMKHYFDGGDYSNGLTVDQAKIYQQFITDGGDETALKMLIGDNEVFESIRSDRALLQRVRESLSGGDPLKPDELKRYDKLLEDTKVRSKMSEEDYAKLTDNSAENQELAELLRIVEDPNTNPTVRANAEQKINTQFRYDSTGAERTEYSEFFRKWDALPKEARIDTLNGIIASGSDDFHAGMFNRKNPHYRANITDEEAAKWAADIRNKEREVDEILKFDQTTRQSAQQAVDNATANKASLEAAKKSKINEIDSQIKLVDKQLKLVSDKATKAQLAQRRDQLLIEKSNTGADFDKQIANAEKTINDLTIAKSNADTEYGNWEVRANAAKKAGNLEIDPKTGLYRKSAQLTQNVKDVETHFKQEGVTRKQASDERDRLIEEGGSEEGLRAGFAQQRAEQVKKLLDEDLVKVRKKVSTAADDEFSSLSDSERAKVSKILETEYDKLTPEQVAELNYYTAKQHGVIDAEMDAAFNVRKTEMENADAFKNFKLNEEIGIDEVSALLRKKGIPSSKVHLTETEWAQIKRADDQVATFKAVLKKKKYNGKPLSDKVIDDLVGEVFTAVEPKSGGWRDWTLFGRKKKGSSSSSSDNTSPDFKINPDRLKTKHKDDNTLIGKILGRSTNQRIYAENLYGFNRKKNLWEYDRATQKAAQHYYQPMVHGLHYNLMRDPIHHTPWYEPKEITIQLENEEE